MRQKIKRKFHCGIGGLGLFWIGLWSEDCKDTDYILHLFLWRKYWSFGKRDDWYDGPIVHYCCGPLFQFIKFH